MYEQSLNWPKLLSRNQLKRRTEYGRKPKREIIPIITINYTFELHLFGLKFRKKTFCIS